MLASRIKYAKSWQLFAKLTEPTYGIILNLRKKKRWGEELLRYLLHRKGAERGPSARSYVKISVFTLAASLKLLTAVFDSSEDGSALLIWGSTIAFSLVVDDFFKPFICKCGIPGSLAFFVQKFKRRGCCETNSTSWNEGGGRKSEYWSKVMHGRLSCYGMTYLHPRILLIR